MLFRILCIVLSLYSFPAVVFASGGVHCEKMAKTLPPLSISWGVGHVTGSSRISPIRLTLSGREILINSKEDPKHLRGDLSKPAERIDLRQVGYWIGEQQLMLWLADVQVSKTHLKLVANIEKDKIVGTVSINDLKGLTMKDVPVVCSLE